LEIVVSSESVAIGGSRDRIVCAALLLTPNRTVSNDRLCDAVWGDDPPTSAGKVLQNLVLRLRRSIGGSVIETRPTGYALVTEPDDVDSIRFERLVTDGRTHAARGEWDDAAALFAEALRQWRGRALPDLDEWPPGRAEAARLEELRRCAEEELANAQLACGRHHDWAAELEALVSDEPLREVRWELLALALYRDGRQAEAMRTFRRARESLAEVGLEPGPDVRQMERSIADQDPALTPSGHVGRPVPGVARLVPGCRHDPSELPPQLQVVSPHPFVGRALEWQCLEEAWQLAEEGRRSVVFLAGEAGAGKSRLVAEFAHACHSRGAVVFFGQCDGELSIAYQPWVSVIEQATRSLSPAERSHQRAIFEDLIVAIPTVRRFAAGVHRTPSPDPDMERHRLFTGVNELLVYCSRRGPVVVVVEDVHWAGEQTLALLRHLSRTVSSDRLLIVGTYRDTGDEVEVPLAALLAELRRTAHVQHVAIRALDLAAIVTFVAEETGQDIDRALREIAAFISRRTGGNAFYTCELWRHVVAADIVRNEGGHWSLQEGGDDRAVPDSVRDVVAGRIARLSTRARTTLDVAAVVGARCELRLLSAAVAGDQGDVAAALDELVTAGVLETVDDPWLTYQFTHDLVRATVEELMKPGARAQTHLLVGETIERVHERDIEFVLPDLARHFLAALPLGDGHVAIRYARLAAAQATSAFAYDEAIKLLMSVAELPAMQPQERLDVLMDLGAARSKHGLHIEARQTYRAAYEIARDLELDETAAHAAIGYEHSTFSTIPGRPAAIMLSEALDRLPPHGGLLYLRTEASLARALALAGSTAEAAARVKIALDTAHRAGDPATLSAVLNAALSTSDDPHQLIEWSDELGALAAQSQEPWDLLLSSTIKFQALVTLGLLARARSTLDVHREAIERGSFAFHQFAFHAHDTVLAIADADLTRAETSANRAQALAVLEGSEFGEGVFGLQMFVIRREQARLDEVLPILELLVSQLGQSRGIWRPGLAALYAEVGMTEAAKRELDVLAKDHFASIPRDSLWPVSTSFLADACIAARDARNAAIVYEQLAPYADWCLMGGMTVSLGPASRYLGGLADVTGRPSIAEQHYADALRLAEASGSPLWRAQVLADRARHRSTTDPDESRISAEQALELATHHGLTAIQDRCRLLL
jgi:DNA-binding SARP family transcriptional activator